MRVTSGARPEASDAAQAPDIRVAIIGYGLSGRVFHGPLVAATAGMEVSAIVTSDPARASAARGDFPRARVVPNAERLWTQRESLDLVVVATSTGSHVRLALAAIEAGLPVVVEKPLAATAAEGRRLVAQAAEHAVLLSVFQNRRWDSDHLTLQRLLGEDALGQVMRYESRFERWRPEPDPGAWRETEAPERGGGVLLDLATHLVDQALVLFGPARAVYAEVVSRRGGADDDVFLALAHDSGVRSHLWASAMAAARGPRLRVLGTRAAFVVDGLDPQEDQLRLRRRADDPHLGEQPESSWGRLVRGEDVSVVRSERGRWLDYYSLLLVSLCEGASPPVDPREALRTLDVLDAARRSADEGTVVEIDR